MRPTIHEMVPKRVPEAASDLAKRINIPLTPLSPAGLVQANVVDPWIKSGKYGVGWTYFALGVTATVLITRVWHLWQDKIRQAMYKQQVEKHYQETYNMDMNAAISAMRTGQAQVFFPEGGHMTEQFRPKAHFSSVDVVNDTLALFRWIFYRPVPDLVWGKRRFTFSSLAVLMTTLLAVAFVVLYCFLQQPLYWQSIRFGSPPLAIRSGMIAVALTPWIIATAMKANILTFLIGIGPERLNVFHRWLSYLCLFLSLVHMVPFLVQPVWRDGGMTVFNQVFPDGSGFIYGTGVATIVPLVWLCVASLPWIRRVAYEMFVALHIPAGMIYVGLLFWHTKNRLLTWDYLYATLVIWAACYAARFFKLNWIWPGRLSFLVGDEAAICLMAENAIKITIPTQMRWKPGQFVYLRMPGISLLENHPFTISSLCSEDFPSEYGEDYRDCVLVFKPYGGFTKKVLETAIEKGPLHTYRAFLDGPYGGMRRDLAAFDTCILIAGGSGITSLMSQLLNLVKRMRDGKAITRRVAVVWSMKKIEALDWFNEELRICHESAPPETVSCKFFVTSAVRDRERQKMTGPLNESSARALTRMFHDRLDGFVSDIAAKRNSAFIHAEAQGDPDRERELRAENEDQLTALPRQQKFPMHSPYPYPNAGVPNQHSIQVVAAAATASEDEIQGLNANGYPEDKKVDDYYELSSFNGPGSEHAQPNPNPNPNPNLNSYFDPSYMSHDGNNLPIRAPELAYLRQQQQQQQQAHLAHLAQEGQGGQDGPSLPFGPPPSGFDFGFPSTPTEFQKNLMRFAFPVPYHEEGGWSIEYGRPQLGYMLKQMATGGPGGRGILGRRTAVFVCGPPSMRVGVANTVAKLQAEIWGDDELEEIYLHTENYAL